MSKSLTKKYQNLFNFIKFLIYFICDLSVFFIINHYANHYLQQSNILFNSLIFVLTNIRSIFFFSEYKYINYLWYLLTPLQFIFLSYNFNLFDCILFYVTGLVINIIKLYINGDIHSIKGNNIYFVGSKDEYKSYYCSNILKNKNNIIHIPNTDIKKTVAPKSSNKLVFNNSKDLYNLILNDQITNDYNIKLLDGNLIQNFLSDTKIKKIEPSMPDLHITRTIIMLSNDPDLTENFINKFGEFGSNFIIITGSDNFKIESQYQNVKVYNVNLLHLDSDMNSVLKSIDGKRNALGNIIFIDMYNVNKFNFQFNFLVSQYIIKNLSIQKQIVLLKTETFSKSDIIHNNLKKIQYIKKSNVTTLFLNIGAIEENIQYKKDFSKTYLNSSFQVTKRDIVSDYLVYLVVLQETHEQQFHFFFIDSQSNYINTYDLITLIKWENPNYNHNSFIIENVNKLNLLEKGANISRLNMTVYSLKPNVVGKIPNIDMVNPHEFYNKLTKIVIK